MSRRPETLEALGRILAQREFAEALLSREPKDRETLYQYVALMGFKIPRIAACLGHDAPLDFFADVFFQKVFGALLLGARGVGKTRMLALLNHLVSKFRPGTVSGHIGAIARQSAWGFEYLRDQLRPKIFTRDLFTNATRSGVIFKNGSQVLISTGSTETGVSAIRCHRLVLDEIDQWTRELFETAQLMVSGTEKNPGQRVMVSTRYAPYGLMNELLKEADRRNWRTYHICLVPETLVGTESGPCRLDQLSVGQKVWALGAVGLGLYPVSWIGQTQRQARVYRLTLENGAELEGTVDHPVLTPEGWKELGNLRFGDVVVIRLPLLQKPTILNVENSRKGELDCAESLYRVRGSDEEQETLFGVLGRDADMSAMWWQEVVRIGTLLGLLEQTQERALGQEISVSSVWRPEGSTVEALPGLRDKATGHSLVVTRTSGRVPFISPSWGQGRKGPRGVRGDSEANERRPEAAVRARRGPVEQRSFVDPDGERDYQGWSGPCEGRGSGQETESDGHREAGLRVAELSGAEVGEGEDSRELHPGHLAAGSRSGNRGPRGLLAQSRRGSGEGFQEAGASEVLADPFAGALGVSDKVRPGQGPALSLARVVGLEFVGRRDVWDCTVAGAHNFLANGILVHNCVFEVMQRCERCEGESCALFRWENPFTGEDELLCRNRGLRSDGFIPRKEVIREFWSTDPLTWAVQKLLYAPSVEKLLYPDFAKGIHYPVEVPAEVLEVGTRCAGVDWGFDHPFALAVWIKSSGGKWYAVEEHRIRHILPEKEIETAWGVCSRWGEDLPFFCGKDEPKSIQAWQAAGLNAMGATSTRYDHGVKRIKQLMSRHRPGGPRFFLSPDCPMTAQEFQQMHRTERGGIFKEKDDLHDASRYGIESAEDLKIGSGGIFRI